MTPDELYDNNLLTIVLCIAYGVYTQISTDNKSSMQQIVYLGFDVRYDITGYSNTLSNNYKSFLFYLKNQLICKETLLNTLRQ